MDHLFRHEAGKMVATLTRIFGPHNLDLAEDVVQDTLCRALETWRFGKVPDNPAAWLMRAARNRAIDVIRKQRSARTFAPDITNLLQTEWTLTPTVQNIFLHSDIPDDQLRMMFTCCHPRLPEQAQVMLILKTLCGFSVAEIAQAFLAGRDAVEKRLNRARKTLADSHNLFEIADGPELAKRVHAVYGALYLLFNEGYHASHGNRTIREDLCCEATRLGSLLLASKHVPQPVTHALLALFHLHAARLPSRMTDDGSLVSLRAQNRASWDPDLIRRGFEHLEQAAAGSHLSEFHLQAGIAAKHCLARDLEDTDWQGICDHYDLLWQMSATPIVALNRAIALGYWQGPEMGLQAIQQIPDQDRLQRYPFFHAALADLHRRLGNLDATQTHLHRAVALARTPAEEQFWRRALAEIGATDAIDATATAADTQVAPQPSLAAKTSDTQSGAAKTSDTQSGD